MVPSILAQCSISKFLTNENVKPAEILMRFGDETLSRSQEYNWSKSFEEDQTEVGNMRRFHLLQGKLWPFF
jgi:hypothetical protein